MSLAAQFQIEYLQYLGPDGKPVAELPQAFRDAAALVPLFKQMPVSYTHLTLPTILLV